MLPFGRFIIVQTTQRDASFFQTTIRSAIRYRYLLTVRRIDDAAIGAKSQQRRARLQRRNSLFYVVPQLEEYHCIDAGISSNFRSFNFDFVDILPLIAEELPYLSRCLLRGSPLQFRKSLVPYIPAIESEIGRAHWRCPTSLRIPRQRVI